MCSLTLRLAQYEKKSAFEYGRRSFYVFVRAACSALAGQASTAAFLVCVSLPLAFGLNTGVFFVVSCRPGTQGCSGFVVITPAPPIETENARIALSSPRATTGNASRTVCPGLQSNRSLEYKTTLRPFLLLPSLLDRVGGLACSTLPPFFIRC